MRLCGVLDAEAKCAIARAQGKGIEISAYPGDCKKAIGAQGQKAREFENMTAPFLGGRIRLSRKV